jgi:glycosyltransferase involved in cell wall biosynthesis
MAPADIGAPLEDDASGDGRIRVTQIGHDAQAAAGMSSVMRAYAALPWRACAVRFVVSYRPSSRLYSVGPWLRALGVVAAAPADQIGVAHVHLSFRGSFVREGALVRIAAWRGIPVLVSIHASGFAAFARSHPRLVRFVLEPSCHILVLAEETETAVRALLPAARLTRIGNPAVASPSRAPSAAHTAPVALFGGDVSRGKGVDVLQEAWRRVHAALPNARLLIAGEIKEPDLISPDPTVEVLGPLPHEAFLDLLGRARVVVLPSRGEALPMVVLEAMASGVPVVTSDVGALPDIVGAGGVVVPCDDAARFADAMIPFLADAAHAGRVGRTGEAISAGRFGPEAVARELERLYTTCTRWRPQRSWSLRRVRRRAA